MTLDEVYTALRSALAASSGVPIARVYRGHQDIPQPSESYLSMRQVTDVARGRAFQVDGTTWRQHRTLTVQVDGVGEGIGEGLLDSHVLLRASGATPDALEAAGIGVANTGPVRTLSRIDNERGWVPILSYDVALSYTRDLTTTPPADADAIDVTVSTDDTAVPATASLTFPL